ncbi:LysR family transcriptional regulator [Bosea sp. (in: a-proteobacteria)]|uniref:LysR family transcriptional regulator n=1 Tax=Bosea sp. (in: a-proteobacteria) TaxID=1871050 RepID=UPI00260A7A4F|nr:LysR family transcriptional regulator [Bosea sp. (in: a-proteobacteria)]MCO5093010.1 LysR family transcriptional regulator [Bosea sp. (in: a-proteobacteria)]
MGEPASPPSRRHRDLASPAGRISWDDIGIFNAVAGGGSMAVAAARLGLSEATVARRLKGLEARLGLQLFTREANRLAPTAIGTELAVEADRVEAAVKRFATRADAARPRAGAPVRITATTSISLFLTMHATTISQAAGGIEIVIISTRDRLDLTRGEADIALRMSRVPDEPGHYAQKVGRLMQALYLRRDADPATAPIISVNRETSSRIDDHIMAYAAGRPIAARVGDSAARYESIRSSGALSMAPCFMGDADPALRRLEPPPEATGDDILLVSHEVSRRRPGVAAVLVALRRLFKEHRASLMGRTAAAGEDR